MNNFFNNTNAFNAFSNNAKSFFGNVGNNIGGVGKKINTALFGTYVPDYGRRNEAYLESLKKRKDFQDMIKQQGLTEEGALRGVMQGLNYSNKQIAAEQDALGIRKPNTDQVELAKQGLFNVYGTKREGGFVNDHPILTALGGGLLGGTMGYIGERLNEPAKYNLVASRYYGDRYTPVLQKPDDDWGRNITQALQGMMMGDTSEPIEFYDLTEQGVR